MSNNIDILAIGAHPDDVELGCGGTIAKHVSVGHSVSIIDLTAGELGTRGSSEIRNKESNSARKILSVGSRFNLEMRDGWIANSEESQLSLISYIRYLRPKIVLCTAPNDRHPDHIAASRLAVEACFKSGLNKIVTEWKGQKQESFRPENLYHYIQFYDIPADFTVDISDHFETKLEAIRAHSSQFFDATSTEPNTLISSKEFYDSISARASEWGRSMGVTYGEGFITERRVGVSLLTDLL
jgi:bacillithiol biosynthesis deacetylase BshB1|tara:strand:- start:163 stop:885 length:723 start_codon:yes stop_codon:yes gene_type:complete